MPETTAEAVRSRLVAALEMDLVGPRPGQGQADEVLPGYEPPSKWYLTGFLIPSGMRPDAEALEVLAGGEDDDDLDEVVDRPGLAEESLEEQKAAKKAFFPSSIGLTFLAARGASLTVRVDWGDYRRVGKGAGDDTSNAPDRAWQRTARTEAVQVALDEDAAATGPRKTQHDVPRSGGLQVIVSRKPVRGLAELPDGTLAVSVFLVNNRPPAPDIEAAEATYAFQAGIEVESDRPFVPRADSRPGAAGEDRDEQIAALHYADSPSHATGHNVSADWDLLADGSCRVVRTTWMPRAEVEKTETFDPPGVDLSMDRLGELDGAADVEAVLAPLLDDYRGWIEARRRELAANAAGRRREHLQTARNLLRRAEQAAERMQQGVDTLCRDADALDAFRVANRAVAQALRRRDQGTSGGAGSTDAADTSGPAWRAFQLAFLLLNVAPLADPTDRHRETVDLLFFPTGGGKTEAYLGLAALAIVLRRLRHPEEEGRAGAGVSVVMRYTLRLLTLDQLARAAGVVCALELERRQDPRRYGAWPFEIGLWVGSGATPNRMGKRGDKSPHTAREQTKRHKAKPQTEPAPIPLDSCPWCRTAFQADSFSLEPDDDHPRNLRVVCQDWECEFSGNDALPIVAVDDPLYRRLPCFLIATVDKFAALPWEARSGVLLGGADRCDQQGFYGAAEPGRGRQLPAPLPGPDLIIQDELHLISGPLGSMTGLYETAIEALSMQSGTSGTSGAPGDTAPKPKIVASTATVRQASEQVRGLFGRQTTAVFPPPGPSRRDSFFARVLPPCKRAARLYVGIASPGRNAKAMMRRVLLPLMAAARNEYREAGGDGNEANPADAYMTALLYFNSLRELGGARRIVEEEISNTLRSYGARRRVGRSPRVFRDRYTKVEPLELTSRVSTAEVAKARARLGRPFHDKGERVDFALATNMISVGLDIQRLGVMVVMGQPKTTAEYIQATSRVGRDDRRPGLVLTLLNVHKPRDRSHYERFRHGHETFYGAVEASSVTPFAARALDRGMAARSSASHGTRRRRSFRLPVSAGWRSYATRSRTGSGRPSGIARESSWKTRRTASRRRAASRTGSAICWTPGSRSSPAIARQAST